MKRILLDENLPLKLVGAAPPSCHVGHVLRVGWAHMLDGELLAEAEIAGYDVFLTADRSIAYQQNLQNKRIALVVLTTNDWRVLRAHATAIFVRALAADVAAIETVTLPHPVRSKRR